MMLGWHPTNGVIMLMNSLLMMVGLMLRMLVMVMCMVMSSMRSRRDLMANYVRRCSISCKKKEWCYDEKEPSFLYWLQLILNFNSSEPNNWIFQLIYEINLDFQPKTFKSQQQKRILFIAVEFTQWFLFENFFTFHES